MIFSVRAHRMVYVGWAKICFCMQFSMNCHAALNVQWATCTNNRHFLATVNEQFDMQYFIIFFFRFGSLHQIIVFHLKSFIWPSVLLNLHDANDGCYDECFARNSSNSSSSKRRTEKKLASNLNQPADKSFKLFYLIASRMLSDLTVFSSNNRQF